MLDTASKSKLNAMKKQLESIASECLTSELAEAARMMLSAINYNDKVLIKSSLNSLGEALRDVVRDIIQKELAATEGMKRGIQEGWHECIDGTVCENFDPLKELIESFIDERIATMTRVQDKLVKALEKRGWPVENAQQLENSIRDMRRFREVILKNWPSLSEQPSAINQQAIAEARTAIKRGEKMMHKEELIWGNDPLKK